MPISSASSSVTVIVYAVVDDALSPDFPLGDALETFICREDAERFVEEVRGDEPEFASFLRIEERGARSRRGETSSLSSSERGPSRVLRPVLRG